MKYIVLRVTDHATKANEEDLVREIPFIFPDNCVHSEVAKYMTNMLRRKRPDGRMRDIEPVSAGFMHSLSIGEKGACHGESETLKLKSRGDQDAALISTFDYLHGLVS
jgi:hypothetical protein